MNRKTKATIKSMSYNIIFALILLSEMVYCQTLSTFDLENANHLVIDSNRTYNSHRQKVLHQDSKSIVILNMSEANENASFTLLQQQSNNGKYVEFPEEYFINDFDILNDTIYFCGRHNVSDDTLSHGFIGYISIADLFFSSNRQCTYSDIRTTTNIQKVLAYHDSTNAIVAAAFGSQYYADIIFIPNYDEEMEDSISGPILPIDPGIGFFSSNNIVEQNPNSTASSTSEELHEWVCDSMRYWDCFAALIVRNIETETPQLKYDLWRLQYENTHEIARDICLTNNYICLTTSFYDTAYSCPPKNQFFIRRIDKNNFENQVTNKMIGVSFSNSTTFDLLKTTCVGGDNIALCYTASLSLGNGNIVYKINLSQNTFNCLLFHNIDAGCIFKPHIWEIKYEEENDVLLVLKEDGNEQQNRDAIWYVSMNPYVYTPYLSTILNFENAHFGLDNSVSLSSLNNFGHKYMVIVGANSTFMTITEKNIFAMSESESCNRMTYDSIRTENSPTFQTDSLMVHCRFAYNSGNGSIGNIVVENLPTYSSVGTFSPGTSTNEHRTRVCLNKETEFNYEKPSEE